ncbi:helix-turn-helix domain-containing protein [Actinomadura kijaniata]|uniref:helix-turn-helix domain-containing protein n=1 Tax=Actinomadura kijaniata TaxID=46161 RepID=UPI003F1D83AC
MRRSRRPATPAAWPRCDQTPRPDQRRRHRLGGPADRHGGGVRRRHDPRLLDTLAAFPSRSASRRRCAADLHVRVNTVRHRMRRLEELTGRNLSRFPDRMDLCLAPRLAEWECRR